MGRNHLIQRTNRLSGAFQTSRQLTIDSGSFHSKRWRGFNSIELNHFAIKGKIYIEALKITYDNPEKMSETQNRLALV